MMFISYSNHVRMQEMGVYSCPMYKRYNLFFFFFFGDMVYFVILELIRFSVNQLLGFVEVY